MAGKKPDQQQQKGRSKGPVDLGGPATQEPFKKIPLRLKDKYRSEVVGTLKEKFNYKNVMQVPRLEKVVINMGVGEAIGNPKLLDMAHAELGHIAGQRPVITRARNSISNFKLREGVKIGTKVTLRSARMWAFLDKLFSVVLPRIRDFRGLSNKSFDGRGNYAIGLKEQTIFPEIQYDKIEKVRGMDIIIVTTAKTDEEASEFLKLLGCPIRTQ